MRVAFAGPRECPNLDAVRRRVRALAPGDVAYFVGPARGELYRTLRDETRALAIPLIPVGIATFASKCDRVVVFDGGLETDDYVERVLEAVKAQKLQLQLEVIGC